MRAGGDVMAVFLVNDYILMVSTHFASDRPTKISICLINIRSTKWVLKLFSKNRVILKLRFHSDQSCPMTPSNSKALIEGFSLY